MMDLKEVNFGLNQYCGPVVLSALTGESTDRCAAVISAVSGSREIKAVKQADIKEALKRLRFDVGETNFSGSSLFGTLFRMHSYDGLYVIFVPHHVVAIEIKNTEIYICDNHTKTPLDVKQSARLTQRVERVWRVTPKALPEFVSSSIKIYKYTNRIDIMVINEYKNMEDNTQHYLGSIKFMDNKELKKIVEAIKREVL